MNRVATRNELLASGVAGSTISRKVRRREWQRLHQAVYLLDAAPPTFREVLSAACAAAGPEAAASHLAAARVLGLPDMDDAAPELTIPFVGRRRLRGVKVHRSRVWRPQDRTVVDGIPVTTRPRTIVDLAGVLHPIRLEVCLDAALRAGARLGSIAELLAQLPNREGARTLHELVTNRGGRVPESVLESMLFGTLRWYGFPLPTTQHWAQTRDGWVRIDFVYVDQRVMIEVEGYETHGARRADWVTTAERRNELVALGWRPVTVVYEHVVGRRWDALLPLADALGIQPSRWRRAS